MTYPLGLTILSNYTLLVADFHDKSIKEFNLNDGNGAYPTVVFDSNAEEFSWAYMSNVLKFNNKIYAITSKSIYELYSIWYKKKFINY